MRRLFAFLAVGITADVSSPMASSRPEYARDVAPLLARACVSCHGGDKPKGGLRLDRPAGLAAVVRAGAGSDSTLVRRLLGDGDGERMPADGPPLPAAQIALVRRWIDEGAAGLPAGAAPHWAYAPPRRPPPPRTRRRDWPRNDIDRFVLARLEGAGLAPAPEADRETLLRRVTLDLTGLPPTLAEIDAYLADGATGAYERVVDRLLASPHFGERWAVPWLDAARYADSNGYEKDGPRAIWRYRDWVVDALNADMPFDRFTLEQIAGDLLPGAGPAQRIATGFHRNTMLNEEGGVDPEEARFERLCDRATTTATVWLGSTLGCARCHDHKHDPFTQGDFYSMLGFFEDGREETLPLPTEAQAAKLAALRAERRPLERALGTWTPALGEAQRGWERALVALPARFHPLDSLELASAARVPLVAQPDGSVFVGARAPAEETEVIAGTSAFPRVTAVRLEALPDPRLPGGGPGRGSDGGFFLSGIDLETAPASGRSEGLPTRWSAIRIARVVADDHPREEPERYAAENLLPEPPPAPSLDADVPRGWGVAANRDGAERLPRQLVLVPAQPFGFPGGTRVRLRLRYGAAAAGEVIGRVRVTATDVDDPGAVAALEARLRRVVGAPEAARTVERRNELAAAFRRLTPLLETERARLAALEREESGLGVVSTLVMAPRLPPASGALAPPSAQIHASGSFASAGERLPAALPAILGGGGAEAPHDRLALGRWLASDANPLAARAAANRIWAQYFGRGLLETSEDFGRSASPPSHPQLLDWLAVVLAGDGWRQKPLHRLIVTSATYRQSSSPADEPARRLLAERDPDNRLLARGPRRRLDAEMVRDVTLAASGLLDERLGGPPVFPPQPAGVWAPPNSTEAPWPTSPAPDRYRRALYVFWRRTAPYPTTALFDTPTRELCTVRRNRTSTPLQALATLNDPLLWDAAGALARRMASVPGPDAAERIALGFRLCTGRAPRPSELAPLVALHERRRHAAAGADGARGADSEQSALQLVANVLLNLDETLTNH